MTKYYAMFTDEGNQRVDQIVQFATAKFMTWSQTYDLLVMLSKKEGFGEATDTAVREMVYDAIEAYKRDEEFYV